MLGQRDRLIILALYITVLLCASKLAFGDFIPATTEKGLWFYSGLAALLLGNLLVTPFYTKLADSISYAVASVVVLLAVWPASQYTNFDLFLRNVSMGYLLF